MPGGQPSTIGRYTVQRMLGRGGMGTVYLAIDPLIEREVAIKVLPLAGADEYSDRLIAEARVSGRLIHPNIVGVFDIGEEQGQPFVVMPYVPGRTVASILTDRDRPVIGTKLRWMAQLCDALAYAHEHRVIHRDIKPTNLLVDDQQNLRVLDFGIAKVLTTSQIQFTSVGTPAYMAPEQYSSDPVDPRTDVFSAGLVFYELLTHRRAFTGTTPAQIYGQLMAGPPPRVLAAAPDADPALAAVCERAMSRDPKDRFQTARAFGDALAEVHQRWLASTLIASTVAAKAKAPAPAAPAPHPDPAPTLATRIDAAAVAAPVAAPVTPEPTFLLPAPEPSRVVWAWPVLTVAAMIAIFGVFWVSRPGPEVHSTPSEVDSPASPSPTPLETPAPGPSPSAQPTETPDAASVPPSSPPPPSLGRIRVVPDLRGTTFGIRREAGDTADPFASNQTEAPPGRWELRGEYIDSDPLLGDGVPIFVMQTIEVVAGQTTNVRLRMEPLLWRRRFVRALQKPVAQGRAVLLDRSYRHLQETGALETGDTARYQQAVSEQQMVKFVKGDLTTDSGGFERFVRYTGVDIVRIDAAAHRIAMVGESPESRELARGRHEFAAVVEVVYGARPTMQSMSCSGSFEVPGGTSELRLKVDTIVRWPPKGDGKVAAECQIGGTTPFVPSPGTTSGAAAAPSAVPPGPTVRVVANGTALAGAQFKLSNVTDMRLLAVGSSDASGVVHVRLPPGQYDVSASREPYFPALQRIDVVAGANPDIVLRLDSASAWTTTNADGTFWLPLDPGLYDVAIAAPGFPVARFRRVGLERAIGTRLLVVLPGTTGTIMELVDHPDRKYGPVLWGSVKNGAGKALSSTTVIVRAVQ